MQTTQGYSSKSEVDIVIQVDVLLDEQNRHRIEYYLLKVTGIMRVQFDKFRQQLLIIGYDSAQTDSSTILKHINQQRLNARLIVGM
jgi:hypothetical protein